MMAGLARLGSEGLAAAREFSEACRALYQLKVNDLATALRGQPAPDAAACLERIRQAAQQIIALAPTLATDAVKLAAQAPADPTVLDPLYEVAWRVSNAKLQRYLNDTVLNMPESFFGESNREIPKHLRQEYLKGRPDVQPEIKDIRQTIDLIIEQPVLAEIFADTLQKCSTYLDKVIELEEDPWWLQESPSPALRSELFAADERRRQAHEALISEFNLLVRTLFRFFGPKGTVEQLALERLPTFCAFGAQSPHRVEIGHWACRMAEAVRRFPQEEKDRVRDVVIAHQEARREGTTSKPTSPKKSEEDEG